MTEKRNIAQNLAEDEVLQWVTFQLENETYGINVMQVQEVLRYTEIAPVPGAGRSTPVVGFAFTMSRAKAHAYIARTDFKKFVAAPVVSAFLSISLIMADLGIAAEYSPASARSHRRKTARCLMVPGFRDSAGIASM
jgi:hypothetical protein